MSQISRPMQIALAAVLVFAVAWFAVLRPKPASEEAAPAPAPTEQSSSSGAAPGTDGLTGAVDKAHEAVGTANGDAARAGQTSADDASGGAAGGAGSAGGSAQTRGARARAARPSTAPIHTRGPVASVRAALRMHKAIAIAFVDSATADSRTVDRELLHVSRFGGRAFTLSVPLADLADYAFITNTVEVTVAPTVVIVDPARRAATIVGATDRFEIQQRLSDALATTKR